MIKRRLVILLGITFIAGVAFRVLFLTQTIVQPTHSGLLPQTAHVDSQPAVSSATPVAQKIPVQPIYPVVRVVDGDTVVLSVRGVEEKVRLIGVDTPEVVDPRKPVQCFGREASNEAKRLLVGVSVRIELDPSQGERDKYGRLLAYLFLEDGTDFNLHMIEAGYGHEYTYHTPYRFQKLFKDAERRARTNFLGMWAKDACGTESTYVYSRLLLV